MKFKVKTIDRNNYLTDAELVQGYEFAAMSIPEPPYPCSKGAFLFRAALGTGARVSEIARFHTRDCDPEGFVFIGVSKTGRSRLVRVLPEFEPWFRAWYHAAGPKDYMFQNSHGNYGVRQLERMWHWFCEAAGIGARELPDGTTRRIAIHGARHSFATWELASRRLDITECAVQLGHANVEMTRQFYQGVVVELLYGDREPRWRAAALGRFGNQESKRLRAVK